MTAILDFDRVDLRQLPHNFDVEQALLGALLLNNRGYGAVADVVQAEHFFDPLHRKIFETVARLIEADQVANPITLRTYLADKGLGGLTVNEYLGRLVANATTTGNARDYAVTVRDLADRRKLIAHCLDTIDRAYSAEPGVPVRSILAEHQTHLENIRPTGAQSTPDFVTLGDAVKVAVSTAAEAYKRNGGIAGLSTGLPRLDDALGGLQPTDLIILAGRPGMGKTALGTNIAFSVAQSFEQDRAQGGKGGTVGFFSLEMSADQLAARILSEQSGIPGWRVRRGKVSEEELVRYIEVPRDGAETVKAVINSRSFLIDQRGGLSLTALTLRAREWKKRYGLDLLVIDYLQLMSGAVGEKGRRSSENRTQEVSAISAGLKALAKELQVPIIALSQLSRKVEERDNKRPMLPDLRESGSIEQDADVVMFVFREEYYLRQSEPPQGSQARQKWEADLRRCEGVAEVIIGKQRNGPAGAVELGFEGEFTRFTNEPEPREPDPPPIEADKRVAIAGEAATVFGMLRHLTLGHGVAPSMEQMRKDKRLTREHRLFPYAELEKLFVRDVMLGEDNPAIFLPKLRKAFDTLQRAGHLYVHGEKPDLWFFSPTIAG